MALELQDLCDGPLWDPSTLNSTSPDLTECFQKTVLVWIPCIYLWLFAPFYIYHMKKHSRGHIKVSRLYVAKTICSILLLVLPFLSLFKALHYSIEGYYVPAVDIVTPAVVSLTMILIFILIQLERLRGVQSSGILFIFWFSATLLGIIVVRSDILQVTNSILYDDEMSIAVHFLYFILMVIMLVLSCICDSPPKQFSEATDSNPCPEASASFLSKITFWWLTGLIIQGYKKPLETSDLWSLNAEDGAGALYSKFEKEWRKETCRVKQANDGKEKNTEDKKPTIKFKNSSKKENLSDGEADEIEVLIKDGKKSAASSNRSLLMTLIRMFGTTVLYGSFCKLLHDILIFLSPHILKLLIRFTEDKTMYDWQGYMYAILIFGALVLQTLVLHQYFYTCLVVGMRIRTVVISTVYRKALSISNDARKTSTVGEMVNLMSVDAQRLMDLMTYLSMIWSAPFQIAVALYFLWMILGPSVLAGLGVMILLIPISSAVGTKNKKLQAKQMKYKDTRIKLMNDILNGIKILKLYAWEESFLKKILGIREKELELLKKVSYLNGFNFFVWQCATVLVLMVTFGVYVTVSEDNILDAEKAFVSLSLFNIIRFPLIIVPTLISNLVQSQVSLKRLQKFLNNEELNPSNVIRSNKPGQAITVEKGVFSWGQEEEPVLKKIDIDIAEGSLVAVVGQVGTGKSSLMSAFLGDLEKKNGNVFVKGSVAYVSQQAWIQNAKLCDNILFGEELCAVKYANVVDACALGPDIEILPAGNQTEIGEKGINLSGGQKQRVSLARAVYSNADIYLLDDPLSAVDAHVGKHIFDHVIGPDGLLKKKTRVLVTHHIKYLPQVDNIIVLEDGEIRETGSYQELLDHNGAFAEFLRNYSSNNNGDDDGEQAVSVKDEHSKLSDTRSTDAMSATDEDKFAIRNLKNGDSLSQDKRTHLDKNFQEEGKHDGGVGDEKGKLIVKEKSETGRVRLSVFWSYVKSMGVFLSIIIAVTMVVISAVNMSENFWLSRWSNEPVINGTQDPHATNMYLGVYSALVLFECVLVALFCILQTRATVKSARVQHLRLLCNLLRCPMEFFESTPTGRITQRCSGDVYTIDTKLPTSLSYFYKYILVVVGVFIVVSINTPMFLIAAAPLIVVYLFIQRFYISTSRQLKRLDSSTRSPIYSHFSETVSGVSTIRAYGHEKRFVDQNEKKIDGNQMTCYPFICATRWLAVRLECIGNCVVFFASLFAVIARDSLSGGVVGLSLVYAFRLTQSITWLVRVTSEFETDIVAVERVKQYSELPTEAAAIVPNNRPSEDWPQTGKVEFVDYSTRYREGLELVIKGINLSIQPRERIGIVGRTGAGKSSLALSLFRMTEAAGGSILIDGVNISKIGLRDLRSHLSIIPQDPVLFTGSLRVNLDPFNQHSDDEIWKILELSHMSDFVSSLADGLEHECAEGGENLSVGQRQLICLARALLRKSRILVLDEATAAIDLETDDLIQATIRAQFADCTVLTIAHRLNTIMDSTRILVLEKGNVVEFDSPEKLLEDRGVFYSLAKNAGVI